MPENSQSAITQATIASFEETPDPRLRQIMTALVRHLHAFVSEVEPTQGEWASAIDYLTRVGHRCQGARQEFILLSDVLGVSMLVDEIGRGADPAATESTVLGPFYVNAPPITGHGADIAMGTEGTPMWIDVEITDTDGRPLPGTIADVWQCDTEGLYDVQRDLAPSEHILRGRFVADDEGRMRCWSTLPVAYSIPSDGPVGDLLAATGRHPWRPAHVHFKLMAEGYAPLVTHLFVNGDKYLRSDAVFGVKDSLVVDLPEHSADSAPAGRQLKTPWRHLAYRFALAKA